jgi:hypothetical protein
MRSTRHLGQKSALFSWGFLAGDGQRSHGSASATASAPRRRGPMVAVVYAREVSLPVAAFSSPGSAGSRGRNVYAMAKAGFTEPRSGRERAASAFTAAPSSRMPSAGWDCPGPPTTSADQGVTITILIFRSSPAFGPADLVAARDVRFVTGPARGGCRRCARGRGLARSVSLARVHAPVGRCGPGLFRGRQRLRESIPGAMCSWWRLSPSGADSPR